MNFEEFLQPAQSVDETPAPSEPSEKDDESPSEEINDHEIELDVQKQVVEQLAADKAEMELVAEEAKAALDTAKADNENARAENEKLLAEIAALKSELAASRTELASVKSELAAERAREFDVQERNPNALALLDRDVELPDRFPGETRDQVLEVLKFARDTAEAEGRNRRAQLLESVLVANEPNGTLAKKREELEKLFTENANIVSGPVIEELKNRGISHKEGEEYLLPSEIIKRNY